tara:strand:- start:515 stop:763 length:249 start_codon:yes stop_codon:yes gene_type:complete
MEPAELIDMMASDAPSSEVSDAIKNLLYVKSAEKVDSLSPQVAAGLFGEPEEGDPLPEVGDGNEPEVNAEVETQDQVQQEEE